MDEILYSYDAERNPRNGFLSGVPLRDLTVAEFAALSASKQTAVEKAAYYVKVDGAKRKKGKKVEPIDEADPLDLPQPDDGEREGVGDSPAPLSNEE